EAAYRHLAPLNNLPGRATGHVREFLPLLALAKLEMEEVTEAQALLARLISEAREAQVRPALAEALRVQALAHMKEARWQDAEHTLAEALDLSRAMPSPYAVAKPLYVSGQSYLQQGAPELARERFLSAQAILEELGERLYARRIEQVLGEQERP